MPPAASVLVRNTEPQQLRRPRVRRVVVIGVGQMDKSSIRPVEIDRGGLTQPGLLVLP
jgi:hypothetical protein